MSMFILILFIGVYGCTIAYVLYKFVQGRMRYKKGNNPFHRICKKCGAHQMMWEDAFCEWWGEVYPLGNDPNCKCHKDVENR